MFNKPFSLVSFRPRYKILLAPARYEYDNFILSSLLQHRYEFDKIFHSLQGRHKFDELFHLSLRHRYKLNKTLFSLRQMDKTYVGVSKQSIKSLLSATAIHCGICGRKAFISRLTTWSHVSKSADGVRW